MSAQVHSINDPRSPLAYARRYIARGWWVLPLLPGTKQPFSRLVPHGWHDASNDPDTIARWWSAEPTAGIGISIYQSKLICVDVDPRNGGYETMEDLEARHGALVSDVLQLTGGGGEHRIFTSQLVENLPGKLGPGVDLKADGYFCAEPSIHPNGRAYGWEASSDPLDGCIPSTLPGWVRDLSRGPAPAVIPATRLVDAKQVAELRDALLIIPADNYHQWVNFGNALVELGQEGFKLWDEWSQKSSKYDPRAVTRKWRSFKPGAIQIESIFFAAQALGWINPMSIPSLPEPVPAPAIAVKPQIEAPIDMLAPPGILGAVVDWVNATSRKPQPQFAIQTAIAFCATVLGRRFVSEQRNWPSLYLLNIGKSASGKEHAKWAVETLLEACELHTLIGPASYTSSAGVLSALHDQPSHITVIDEFGKELEQASVKVNARAQSTMKSLIEVWGRCDGTMRPQGYSTFGMSASDAAKIKERSVRNPALTLLAMTTPDSFFDTIGSAAARDGFLNRFLIVESDIGRQASSAPASTPVPDQVIQWARDMHAVSAGLVNPSILASVAPVPVEVAIAPQAHDLFRAFDSECIAKMDAYDENGLAEMFGRTNEIAMRLAMVAALADSQQAPFTVHGHHAAWAIQYTRHHAQRTVERLATSVHDSEFEAAKQQVMALIRKAGERGMTEREIDKASRKFRAMNQRQQIELLNSLQFVGHAQRVTSTPTWGRGKPRTAWVVMDNQENDQCQQPPTDTVPA